MKFAQKLLLTSAALMPFSALADVEISIPRDVQLMIVNGEDIGYSSFGFDYQETLTVPNGTNQLVFRIAKVVNDGGSKSTKFKSHPLVATFTESDSKLTLKTPRVTTLSQGNSFNSKPSFTLQENGTDIPSLKIGQIKVGFTIMPDMAQEVKNFNASSEPASLRAYAKSTIKPAASAQTMNTSTHEGKAKIATASDLESLQILFKQSSEEDRKAFLSWAISNIN